MKMSAFIRAILLPRDYDREQHSERLRTVKETSIKNRQASKNLRHLLKALDVVDKVADVGHQIIETDSEAGPSGR